MRERFFLYTLPALVCLCGFTAVAIGMQNGVLSQFDEEQTARLYQLTRRSPGAETFFRNVTDLGYDGPLTAAAVSVVVLALLKRHFRLALTCTVVMLLNRESIWLLKQHFLRPRPPFVDWPPHSFPSGHAQGSLVVYGLGIFVTAVCWPRGRFRWVSAAVLGTLIVLIGLSRLMLGVHYFTDVLAGFLMGMFWIGLAMKINHRPRPFATPPAAAPPPSSPRPETGE